MTLTLPPEIRTLESATTKREDWQDLLAYKDGRRKELPLRWASLFAPFFRPGPGPFVIGQLGQSLDGRIATTNGQSKYINGEDCLTHLHRLRAVCDGVVIGVGTAIADNPKLTVRLAAGNNPARIVIDPNGRMPASTALLHDASVRRVVITRPETTLDLPADVEILRLAADAAGMIPPAAMVDALGNAGFKRLLIEGGGQTISHFVSDGCLDRLHLLVAPMIIGAGQAGLELSPISCLSQALRPTITPHKLGSEMLFDCDFRSQQQVAAE